MAFIYSAENHDWDLTLAAAAELAKAGFAYDALPRAGSLSMGFSFFTGSMLLSFAAIESFSASVAFSMPSLPRFQGFDYGAYRNEGAFWRKVDMLFDAIPHKIDKSKGFFQKIEKMRSWRNLVAHSSPYAIKPTEVSDTTEAAMKLQVPYKGQSYTALATASDAKEFYDLAVKYIDLLKSLTSIDPRATVSYSVAKLEDEPHS